MQELLCTPPPAPPRNALVSVVRDDQERRLGREAFNSDLDWCVFRGLCREAGVEPPLSLHELMPAAGMFVERTG